MQRRLHAAAMFEFAIPLIYSVLFLRVVTARLDGHTAGLVVILSTLTAFAAGLEVMGGRALAGYVARLPGDQAIQFILGKVSFAAGSAIALGLSAFAICFQNLPVARPAAASEAAITAIAFSASAVLSQLSNYALWSRLGLGQARERSTTIASGNVVACAALLATLPVPSPPAWLFAIPFLARDLYGALVGAIWLQRLKSSNLTSTNLNYPKYISVAFTTVSLNLVTALFEPLSKLLFANLAGLSLIPALDLTMRGLSAVRNGLVIFVQTYTNNLASGNAELLVQRLEAMCLALAVASLSAGWIAMRILGPHIVGSTANELTAIYGPLCLPVGLNACLIPRYLQLYVQGRIGQLVLTHVAQAVLPVLAWLSGTADTQAEILSVISFSYLIGAAVTVAFGRRQKWFAASKTVSISILIVAAGYCYGQLTHPLTPTASISNVIAAILTIVSTAFAWVSYRRLLNTRLVR